MKVTVKIRQSATVRETVDVVTQLVAAGASLVCVHGRPIHIKNHQVGGWSRCQRAIFCRETTFR